MLIPDQVQLSVSTLERQFTFVRLSQFSSDALRHFFHNAHDLRFCHKPLTVVCNLLLQVGCKKPSLISYAACCSTLNY